MKTSRRTISVELASRSLPGRGGRSPSTESLGTGLYNTCSGRKFRMENILINCVGCLIRNHMGDTASKSSLRSQ